MKKLTAILVVVIMGLFIGMFFINKTKKLDNNIPKTENPSNATENIVTIPELSLRLSLPAGYTMGEDVNNKNSDANFGSYSFNSHEKQGLQPTLQRLSLYSEESIKEFTKNNCADTGDWEGNPCAKGGYPGLENYLSELKAFNEQNTTYNNAVLKEFNGQNFYYSKARCNGDSCQLYYYTTYIGNTKIDFSLISWDLNGQKNADELFGKLKLNNL